MTLFISLKDQVAKDLREPRLADTFRQIELWANQLTWRTPTLGGSWTSVGSPYNPAGYWKDALGQVHLRGVIRYAGTIAAGGSQTAFTLPLSYRPGAQICFPVCELVTPTTVRCDVHPDGSVWLVNDTASPIVNPQMDIDPVYFQATH